MANIAQSYIILYFSIKCMFPLVILSFRHLIRYISWLAVAISYPWFYSVKLGLFLG